MLIPRELDDLHAHEITITGAEVSRDMSSARIYFSLLSGSADAKQVAKSLNRAAGFLRHLLMERVSLRNVPALRFYFDESVERGARIDSLIEQAIAEDKEHKD
jgi:ribosome-binding factor A